MIKKKELELFEKKMRDKECRSIQGEKILTEMIRCIKDATDSSKHNTDDWSDYGAWDNWDRGR